MVCLHVDLQNSVSMRRLNRVVISFSSNHKRGVIRMGTNDNWDGVKDTICILGLQ